MLAANRDRSQYVFLVTRQNNADWYLAVVGAIGCVERAATRVEPNLPAQVAAEGGFEGCGVNRGVAGGKRASGDVEGSFSWSRVGGHGTQTSSRMEAQGARACH